MAYLTEPFAYDIFVSYAHGDPKHTGKSKLKHWSEQLVEELEGSIIPSIGPGDNGEGEIIFQNGSSLIRLNLRNRTTYQVNITIPGDRPSIRTKSVDVSKFIQGWGASSTGKRAAIQARGDIWTAPAEKGEPRNLTQTDGVAERDPSWSPDGRWIAYFSDATGEYELYITQSDGKGETKQLTSDGTKFRFNPRPPDPGCRNHR